MNYWSKLAAGILPYVPGEQPKEKDLIKLNTNENPYPPSPKVLSAIHERLTGELRLYPDPESSALCDAIAIRHGVERGEVFVGNGSDEVLALCFPAYFERDRAIRFADVTYSFYEVYAALYSIPVDRVALNTDFSLPIERFFGSEGGVIISNPNAPTSLAITRDDIEAIVKNNPTCVVIIDEAYAEFGAQSAVPLIRKYPNLLVAKTFSKSHALAGLRVGYALGSATLLEALYRVKNSFNSYPLDRLAQAGAIAAIEDESYTKNVIAKIIETRKWSIDRLRAAFGARCLDSSANFIFATFKDFSGEKLLKELRLRGILVRRFNRPRIEDYLRITVGTESEMERLFFALEDILGRH